MSDDEGAEPGESSGDGDGDGDSASAGDGDGDPTAGDGDGDPTAGDGDGDPTAGDGDGDPTAGDGDGDPMPDCTGPFGTAALPPDAMQPAMPKDPGSSWAYFELEDFQPQSCNFGESYSLEAFKGRVTLVTLMRSTCEICQGTLVHLEQMQLELGLAGHDVYMVAINQMGYDDTQQEFIDRTSFPLLQDTAEVDAWDLMNIPMMGTDDMYIYDAQGVLHSYFSYAQANPNIDLGTEAGWDVIYGALVAASEG